MADAEFSIRGGKWTRDKVSERFRDDPANRMARQTDEIFKSRCRDAMIQGFRLLAKFGGPVHPPVRKEGPLFLGSPEFDWRVPANGQYADLRTIGKVSLSGKLYAASGTALDLLAEERFEDLVDHPDKTSVTLSTRSLGESKSHGLFTVTESSLVWHAGPQENLPGDGPDLNIVLSVMNDMQREAFPKQN